MKSLVINQQLFAEAYLKSLLVGQPAGADAVRACWQTIKEWREFYADISAPNDLSQYVGQCLSTLGLSYVRQGDSLILYADQTLATPLGLCLLVTDDDLGRTTKGRHHQANLVRALRQQSLTWGIVTNGRDWRLCHAAVPAPYELYLQTDLDSMLTSRDLRDFSLFHRFFGRTAFAADVTSPDGKLRCGLDGHLAQSESQRETIQRYLRGRVESVLGSLCLGFVQDEGAAADSRVALDEIYRNAIYLLYRILFLFYAEARNMLPVDSPDYQVSSLASILEQARARQEAGSTDADPWSLWRRLTHLFVIVDDGDETLGVRPYNGGLFSDTEKPYLKAHKIANAYLAPALYDLGFHPQGKLGVQPIDYRDLTVRHLGTLYEGLLEYKLNVVADEPVVVREKDGKRQYIPQSQAGPIKRTETILDIGQVYFADDKGERKSSGSYYTPEDVVQYIVSHTVTPKLHERLAGLGPVLEEARRARAIAATPEERRRIERYADQQMVDAVERAALGLKVLDPAMGSAHFLVAAGQIITDTIIETLNQTEWPNDEVDCDPLLWKRRVVERCLFGVDVNPLAQELAKLALWLSSASAGKPLTFLDHHLKVGNSLYGAPLARLGTLPGATKAQSDGFFDLLLSETIRTLLEELKRIAASDSDRIEDVKFKEQAYEWVTASSRRLRDVANVWLATLFGLRSEDNEPLSEGSFADLRQECIVNYASEAWESYVEGDWRLREARRIADEQQFFHWELEFPEVVENGRCAFDVIVANPPYVGTSPDAVVKSLYETNKCGDLYAWILERALTNAGSEARIGTIVPLSLMFAGNKASLRQLLAKESGDVRLVSCDNNPDAIFEASGSARNRIRTTIVVLDRSAPFRRILTTDYLRWTRSERTQVFDHLQFADTTRVATLDYFPAIGNHQLVEFLDRLRSTGHKLSELVSPIGTDFLCVQSAACYFVAAVPVDLKRRNQEFLWFSSPNACNLAFALLNSNVFYWYWRCRSDGFWVSRDQILNMPIPELTEGLGELHDLSKELWHHAEEVTVNHNFNGKMVTTYYFNRRMSTLLKIDDWIVSRVAPDLDLPHDVFAQYKSNSFLRPLDLNASVATDDQTGDE